MFDALTASRGGCMMHMAVFTGASAGNYGVFTQQVGARQHRFVLPLFEPSVTALLESLRGAPIQLSLGRHGEGEALLIRRDLPWSEVSQVMALTQRIGDISVTDVMSSGREISIEQWLPTLSRSFPTCRNLRACSTARSSSAQRSGCGISEVRE
jgi:hypothetical protein